MSLKNWMNAARHASYIEGLLIIAKKLFNSSSLKTVLREYLLTSISVDTRVSKYSSVKIIDVWSVAFKKSSIPSSAVNFQIKKFSQIS